MYDDTKLIIGVFLVSNSLFEDYLLPKDLMNKVMCKVEISFIDDKLLVKDAYTAE
jgi:hypothetical protein